MRVSDVLSQWGEGQENLCDWTARVGRSWRNIRDRAASIGTLTHEAIENCLRGDPTPPSVPDDMKRNVEQATYAWSRWYQSKQDIVTLAVERTVVRQDLGVGGTADLWCELDGVPTIVDWKTSSGIRKKHKVQLAAYWLLAEAEGFHPEQLAVVRLDRNFGVYEEKIWSTQQCQAERSLFLHMTECAKLAQKVRL